MPTITDEQFERAVEALISAMDYASRTMDSELQTWRIRYNASFNILRICFEYEQAKAVEAEAVRRAKLRGITPITIARA